MSLDPLLSELWLVALCAIVNQCPPRIHADVAEEVALRSMLLLTREDARRLLS